MESESAANRLLDKLHMLPYTSVPDQETKTSKPLDLHIFSKIFLLEVPLIDQRLISMMKLLTWELLTLLTLTENLLDLVFKLYLEMPEELLPSLVIWYATPPLTLENLNFLKNKLAKNMRITTIDIMRPQLRMFTLTPSENICWVNQSKVIEIWFILLVSIILETIMELTTMVITSLLLLLVMSTTLLLLMPLNKTLVLFKNQLPNKPKVPRKLSISQLFS